MKLHILTFLLISIILDKTFLVNDRAGQNRARPNRAGSVDFTEGSAEPARPSFQGKIAKIWSNFSQKFCIPKICKFFLTIQH